MLNEGRAPTSRRSAVRGARLRFNPVEGGLHLKDSVLSLDVYGEANLSFVSSAKTTLRELGARRIIATEETVRIVEALRKKKLTR